MFPAASHTASSLWLCVHRLQQLACTCLYMDQSTVIHRMAHGCDCTILYVTVVTACLLFSTCFLLPSKGVGYLVIGPPAWLQTAMFQILWGMQQVRGCNCRGLRVHLRRLAQELIKQIHLLQGFHGNSLILPQIFPFLMLVWPGLYNSVFVGLNKC